MRLISRICVTMDNAIMLLVNQLECIYKWHRISNFQEMEAALIINIQTITLALDKAYSIIAKLSVMKIKAHKIQWRRLKMACQETS